MNSLGQQGVTLVADVYCCCAFAQSCPRLCSPVNRSTPAFPVLHCLLEPAQTHVHWVSQCLQLSNLMRFPLMLVYLFACVSSHLLLFSLPGMSDSFQPHKLQHARPLCPLPFPKVCPSSFPLHQWCHPAISFSDALFSFCPQSFAASGTFQWVICSYQMTKILGFSFSISPSNKYSGLISLKMDWFNLLAFQATFRSLLQHHSAKASIPWHFTFFKVLLSQPYRPLGWPQPWLYGSLSAE